MEPFAEALKVAHESDTRHERMRSGDYVLMFIRLEWEESRSGYRHHSLTMAPFLSGETTDQIGDRLAETLRGCWSGWTLMREWDTTYCTRVHLWTDGPRMPRHAGRILLRHAGVRRELMRLKYTGP